MGTPPRRVHMLHPGPNPRPPLALRHVSTRMVWTLRRRPPHVHATPSVTVHENPPPAPPPPGNQPRFCVGRKPLLRKPIRIFGWTVATAPKTDLEFRLDGSRRPGNRFEIRVGRYPPRWWPPPQGQKIGETPRAARAGAGSRGSGPGCRALGGERRAPWRSKGHARAGLVGSGSRTHLGTGRAEKQYLR